MKMKFWSPVLAGAVIALSAASAHGQSQSPSVKVTCETREGIPTTIATGSEGIRQDVFHWQADNWFHNKDAQTLCEDVSLKLQTYYDNGGRGSSFNVHETASGKNAICVESTPGDSCSGMLFILDPSYSPDKSKDILDSILNDALKPTSSQERGDHRRINRVSLWKLLFQSR